MQDLTFEPPQRMVSNQSSTYKRFQDDNDSIMSDSFAETLQCQFVEPTHTQLRVRFDLARNTVAYTHHKDDYTRSEPADDHRMIESFKAWRDYEEAGEKLRCLHLRWEDFERYLPPGVKCKERIDFEAQHHANIERSLTQRFTTFSAEQQLKPKGRVTKSNTNNTTNNNNNNNHNSTAAKPKLEKKSKSKGPLSKKPVGRVPLKRGGASFDLLNTLPPPPLPPPQTPDQNQSSNSQSSESPDSRNSPASPPWSTDADVLEKKMRSRLQSQFGLVDDATNQRLDEASMSPTKSTATAKTTSTATVTTTSTSKPTRNTTTTALSNTQSMRELSSQSTSSQQHARSSALDDADFEWDSSFTTEAMPNTIQGLRNDEPVDENGSIVRTIDISKRSSSVSKRLLKDKLAREKVEAKQEKADHKASKKLAKKRKIELIKQKKQEIKMLSKIDPEVLEEERAARAQDRVFAREKEKRERERQQRKSSTSLLDTSLTLTKNTEKSRRLKRRWSLSSLSSSFRRAASSSKLSKSVVGVGDADVDGVGDGVNGVGDGVGAESAGDSTNTQLRRKKSSSKERKERSAGVGTSDIVLKRRWSFTGLRRRGSLSNSAKSRTIDTDNLSQKKPFADTENKENAEHAPMHPSRKMFSKDAKDRRLEKQGSNSPMRLTTAV